MLLRAITSTTGLLGLEGYDTIDQELSSFSKALGTEEKFSIVNCDPGSLLGIEKSITRHYEGENYTRSKLSRIYAGRGYLAFSSKEDRIMKVITLTLNNDRSILVSVTAINYQ